MGWTIRGNHITSEEAGIKLSNVEGIDITMIDNHIQSPAGESISIVNRGEPELSQQKLLRGIVMENCHGNSVSCEVDGAFDISIHLANSSSNTFVSSVVINSGAPRVGGIPRNSKCPCGSGVRFRHCHGVVRMGIGIKVEGDNNDFPRASVYANGDGIVVKGNGNKFPDAKVFLGEAKIQEVIALLKLPDDTPPSMLREVIEAFEQGYPISSSEKFRLETWLYERGRTIADWTQLLVDIGRLVAS